MTAPTAPRPTAALVDRQQAAALEDLRVSLPLLDPDRHALDIAADAVFAGLAPHTDVTEAGGH